MIAEVRNGTKMKILHIIPSIDPKGGGPMEGVRQYGTRANELGHKIEVLSLDDPTAPYLAEYPLEVHAIGPSRGGYAYNSRLKGWLQEHATDYDAVIINGLWMYHGFGAWRALRKMSVPYFVFTHGMLDPWFKRTYPLKHLKKWLYWPWAEYRVLRDAKRVLFTCEQERILAKESFWLYKVNEAVVNYGAGSPPEGSKHAARSTFLKAFPELEDKRIVLFLSRIHVKKGCDLLLRAFAELAGKQESAHLVIAGPSTDDYLGQLKALADQLGISDRVTWPGMLRGEMKWGAFSAAEVFALPSHQENFGIAVAEALSSGLPVLISNQVNIWREIVEDQAGIAEPDTVEGTIAALKRWFSLDQPQRLEMARRASSCFQSRFTAEAMAASVTETIGKAIAK